MGRPPAYLFVVRHGLRLDAADKQWHLSSPTPYDPPLTYNGWQQAKNLGVRIANIIRERVAEEEVAQTQSPDVQGKRRRKKYKVAIHSSPFLRCIQTSIAISAGLAQDSTPFGASPPVERDLSPPMLSPRSKPTIIPDTPEPAPLSPKTIPIRKSVLRLDAFLGEWLSPGYFEHITPPPESLMMVASAKAELLRREDYSNLPNFPPIVHSTSANHLWNSGSRANSMVSNAPSDSADSAIGMGSLHRTISASSSNSLSGTPPQSLLTDPSGYVSPVPHWAINPKHTIPLGYVSHARDACVDIDYQWDSTRTPLDWGDGGSFPEEWTDMHKRLRKGVQHLVDWYSTAENPTDMVTKTVSRFARKASIDIMGSLDEEDDAETEAIVILVSHGAGCNALIGALTHEPVLMDVAMASLTMAVRKPNIESLEGHKISRSTYPRGWASPERHSDSVPIHKLYDVLIRADTDHLRSPPTTPAASRSPSMASVLNNPRGRNTPTITSALNSFTFNDGFLHRSSSASAAVSPFRRGGESSSLPSSKLAFSTTGSNGRGGITTTVGATKSFGLSRTPSIGLWSPVGQRESVFEDEEDEDEPMLLNFSHEKLPAPGPVEPIDLTPQIATPRPLASEGYFDGPGSGPNSCLAEGTGSSGLMSPISMTGASHGQSPKDETGGGLWASTPPPMDDADRLRDTSSTKRRWTVGTEGANN